MFNFVLAIVWLVLFVLGWANLVSKHGHERKGKYNAFTLTAFWSVPIYLISAAYFFN